MNDSLKMTHNSRCYKCKNIIYDMLREVFGEDNFKQKFPPGPVSVLLQAYEGSEVYLPLKTIFLSLTRINGYKDFVGSRYLRQCDIYIPREEMVIELDERQHFSHARQISLETYPPELRVGYDKLKYIQRCESIGAVDHDPPHRDEQRAWFDTLRDFLPRLSSKVKKPTVRIPLGFYDWCKLSPQSVADVSIFRRLALEQGR